MRIIPSLLLLPSFLLVTPSCRHRLPKMPNGKSSWLLIRLIGRRMNYECISDPLMKG